MEELDLKQLMSIIWRKKIAIILVVIIFGIIGTVYSYKYVKPMYKSTSTIILGKVTSSNGTSVGHDMNYPETTEMISQSDLSLNSSLIETYSELVKSKTLIQEVKNNLKLNIETENLMKSISVSRVNTSDLLEVTAINENPENAKQIVSEVVRIFSDNVKEIYSISNVYIIDAANIPDEPYNVNHVKDILIFILIGFFLSLGYVLIYNIIDNTVKSSYDIENVLKLKTLITIPLGKKNKDELITVNESKSIISEAFRTLRTNVQFSNINSKEQKTLLITSCLPEEGKSYVSANLAITFAQAGKKVILVDSDMRRGRQAKIFNVPNQNGLSNYISNMDSNGTELNWPLGKYIKETSINNLNLITAGNIPPNPAELLESERVVELIEELKKYYDTIIFDGAPLLPITDSLLLARLLGKTMLVAVYNKTKKDNLLKAKSSIENVGGKIIGICLNKVSDSTSEYSDNYYYYSNLDKEIDTLEKIRVIIKNFINKIKTMRKRLEANNLERNKAAEEKALEQAKLKEEKLAKQAKIAEEKAKKEVESLKIKEAEKVRKEADKVKQAEEKAKKDAELAEKRQEERKIKEAEKIIRDAEKKKIAEENKEKFKQKIKTLKEKLVAQKEKFSKEFQVKKEQVSKKYEEYKIKRQEKNKIKKEQKAIKDAEKAKLREEKRIQQEERKLELAKEREKIQAEIAKKKEEERILKEAERQKRAEEKAIEQAKLEEERAARQAKLAEEKAIKEAEALRIKEEEKARREAEKLRQAEEKARKEAELAEQRAKKEAENLRIREEEKERKAREKEDAKYTDEYLEDNLYPKTKYNKF